MNSFENQQGRIKNSLKHMQVSPTAPEPHPKKNNNFLEPCESCPKQPQEGENKRTSTSPKMVAHRVMSSIGLHLILLHALFCRSEVVGRVGGVAAYLPSKNQCFKSNEKPPIRTTKQGLHQEMKMPNVNPGLNPVDESGVSNSF